MPTPFAMVLLVVVVVAAVAGVVVWAVRAGRRSATPARPSPRDGAPREGPWAENTAAAPALRQSDRGGWQ